MSNFRIFNHEHLEKLLEPFLPGVTKHITPIHYEAITPDLFLFLFRTTGRDGQEHFFVSLEADQNQTFDGAKCTIEDWHSGDVIEFLPLSTASKKDTEDFSVYQSETAGSDRTVLAKVSRPTKKGYWSNAIKIMPGDVIGEKIEHLTDPQKKVAYNTLREILRHGVDDSKSFIDSLNAKDRGVIVDDRNETDMAVSLFVKKDNSVEAFYNWVPTAKNNSRKPHTK